jgi:superfamily II DNA or RNA helicase
MDWLAYERFIIDFHQQKHKDAHVWHWHNIPEDELWRCGWLHDFSKHRMMKHRCREEGKNARQEYGLDGLARYAEGHYSGIQAKYWLGRKKLTANDLGTYMLAVTNMKRSNAKSYGTLYHTCGLEKNLAGGILNCSDFIHAHKLPFSNNGVASVCLNETTYEPYAHQLEALEVLREGWEGAGVLSMPPGTGKTLIFARHVLESAYKNVILLSPLQAQAEQNLRRVKEFLKNEKDALKVDCEGDGTRDVQLIRDALQKGVFISSTYDSVDVLLEATEGMDLTEDLLIIDESHNIIGNLDIQELMERFVRSLLVSGTPPNRFTEEEDEPQTLYRLAFRDAIQNGYITDYQVYVPVLKTEVVCDHNHAQAEFLATGMLRTGARRCIAYLPTVEECGEFLKTLKRHFEDYHAETFWGESITCEVGSGKREAVLAEFKGEGDVFKVIASVRILDEGIDIPECDCVFINNVAVRIGDRGHMRAVQRLCRAVRKDKTNPSKVAKAFVYAEDDESLANLFALLKDNDPEFHLRVRTMSAQYDEAQTSSVVAKEAARGEELVRYIDGIETLEERSMRNAIECVAWVKEHNKKPRMNGGVGTEKTLGKWLSGTLEASKGKGSCLFYPQVKAYLDEHLPGWSDNIEIRSLKNAQACVAWVKENNRMPSSYAKDEKEKKYGSWLLTRRQASKEQGGVTLYPRVKAYLDAHLPGWSDDFETTSMKCAQACVAWIQEHKRNPTPHARDEVEKTHGHWIANKRAASKGQGFMRLYPGVKAYLDKYLPNWTDDFEAISMKSAHACIAWIHKYKKHPSTHGNDGDGGEEKTHGKWLCKTRQGFKGKGVLYPRVKAYLDEQLVGWSDDLETISLKSANACVVWIQEHKKNPSYASKDDEEVTHAKWLGNMRRASKGTGSNTPYPRVIAELDASLPGWQTAKTLKISQHES